MSNQFHGPGIQLNFCNKVWWGFLGLGETSLFFHQKNVLLLLLYRRHLLRRWLRLLIFFLALLTIVDWGALHCLTPKNWLSRREKNKTSFIPTKISHGSSGMVQRMVTWKKIGGWDSLSCCWLVSSWATMVEQRPRQSVSQPVRCVWPEMWYGSAPPPYRIVAI